MSSPNLSYFAHKLIKKHPKPNKSTFEKNTKRSRHEKTKQINTNQQRIVPVCRYVKI